MRKLSLKLDRAFQKKRLISQLLKSDFSIAQSFGRDQRSYLKINKNMTLLVLEPRIF